MIELIRRRDPHRPDRWKIYFGDVCIGDIGPRAGVPTTVDQLEWYCGFVPPAHRGVDAGGTAIDLHDARQKFEVAWRKLRTAFTDDDFAAYRYARAWTAWNRECGRTAASCRHKRRMAARDASAA
ncbi:hypothetical protein [Bradyrhizobium sp. sBnM-33]|uniref:hypothetical protein n=1 Tax=Bradyrhizobium sp. sBnM-33 TaxID=2831780 RepID=UPI001BD196A5|nr:hypothetical protein [Bradyrhizobium sp. sBnM-33]WOH53820.1 hypothetical protein RX328_18045 [Bradyrhizobium sp. sBnM-33]